MLPAEHDEHGNFGSEVDFLLLSNDWFAFDQRKAVVLLSELSNLFIDPIACELRLDPLLCLHAGWRFKYDSWCLHDGA